MESENSVLQSQKSGASISPEDSRRITALRFLLIVFVVFIHVTPSPDSGYSFSEPTVFKWFKAAFLEICHTAVPLFFLFAGYLQFSKRDSYTMLLKKRAKNLFAPYVLWTLLCMLFYFVAQSVPQFSAFFKDFEQIRTWSAIDYVKAFTIWKPFEEHKQPLMGQFWYLRDLMIMIALSPILTWLSKKCSGLVLFFISLFFICDIPVFFVATPLALFFYMAGWYCAEFHVSFFKIADSIRWIEYGMAFLFVMILKIASSERFSLHNLDILLCCLLVLKCSRVISENEKSNSVAAYLSAFSFFLYAIHWPFIVNPLKAVFLKAVPTSGAWCVLQFIAPGLLTVAIGTGIGIALKKLCPPLFSALNGGRK